MGCFCFGQKKKENRHGNTVVTYGDEGPKDHQPTTTDQIKTFLDVFSSVSGNGGGGGGGAGGGQVGGGQVVGAQVVGAQVVGAQVVGAQVGGSCGSCCGGGCCGSCVGC
ncbi:unnamed protein product [Lupinus luteus]|uniref:Uncharacterized protein n=1 Tax=Lupinus luteus TaxID=3873 RepID=A0AAV1Y2P1_LUPLU